jgi:hypothetical protein
MRTRVEIMLTPAPIRKVAEDAALIETMQAAAALAGHVLPDDLKAMTSAARDAAQAGGRS